MKFNNKYLRTTHGIKHWSLNGFVSLLSSIKLSVSGKQSSPLSLRISCRQPLCVITTDIKQIILLAIIALTLITCSDENNKGIERIVNEYYEIYSKRQNIDKFLGYYDHKIEFEDIINGDKIKGKTDLKKILNWENPNFKMLESNSLKITEKIINGNKAVVKGYFTKFQWGEIEFGPMHFTTILTFSDSGKIIKQVDWINYPSDLVNYNKRKNSNKWIKYSPHKVLNQ